jgi:hypothetical protein
MKSWRKYHSMTQAQREQCEALRKKFAALAECIDLLPECDYSDSAQSALEASFDCVEKCFLLCEPETN